MSKDGIPDTDVSRFLVFGAYGETMFRFQMLEMTLWQILSLRLKQRTTLDQALGRVEGWSNQTLGRLAAAVRLPEDLTDQLEKAVEARNYLAHGFLRDRLVQLRNASGMDQVAEEIAHVSARLEALEERLSAYLASQGVDPDGALSDAEIERLIESIDQT